MNSLPNVIISADAIAMPESISAIAKLCDSNIDDYLSRLLSYSNFYDEKWLNVFIEESDIFSLEQEKLLPSIDSLKEILGKCNEKSFSAEDIYSIINKLLKNILNTKKECGVEFSLGEKFESVPDISNFITNNNFINKTKYHLVLSAIIREHLSSEISEHHIILNNTPAQKINVEAHVLGFKNNTNEALKLPTPPNLFKGIALVCKDLSGLVQNIDENDLLFKADDKAHVALAIRIGLFKYYIKNNKEKDWSDLETELPIITDPFLKGIKEQFKSRNNRFIKSTLNAIIVAITQKSRKAHSVRKSTGGKREIRKSDSGIFQRSPVADGVRMHYYQLRNGRIELASIENHDDIYKSS